MDEEREQAIIIWWGERASYYNIWEETTNYYNGWGERWSYYNG